jgi:hypothetical protein
MILDFDIELENIEKQPEWCKVMDRVRQLKDEKNRLIIRLDKDPKEWIQKSIEKCDSEIKFFENILLFWSRNYRNLEAYKKTMDKQIEVSNHGAKLTGLIDDLRTAFRYQENENLVIIQTFIKLCKEKELDAEKIESVLFNLRTKTKEYVNYINGKINNIVNGKE